MMRTALAFVCAAVLSACAWGESSSGDDDTPTPDAPPAQIVCGDGTCAPSEVGSCTQDCGGTTSPVCGNGSCENGETNSTCPADCAPSGPICGDAVCDTAGGENPTNCPGDCQGGSAIDCNDQNVLLSCFLCVTDPMFCTPPLTQADCQTCIGGP